MDKISFGRPVMGEEEKKAVEEVLSGTWILNGPKVKEFEDNFKKYTGSNNCASVTNATAGMHITFEALGIGPGDEVILPAFNFIAAGLALLQVNATPVFVDIEPITLNIDPSKIEEKITNKTKAIFVLHYAGHSANMDPILDIAKKHNLRVIEDAAHALGTTYKNKKVGTLGDATIFSFGPLKMISCAMGGMITTTDPEVDNKLRVLRSYGMDKSMYARRQSQKPWYYEISELGHNFRMTDVLAAIGLAQLKKLPSFLSKRREIAMKYNKVIGSCDYAIPPIEINGTHAYLYYVVRFKTENKRNEIMQRAKELKIGLSVHWDPPLHHHPLFEKFAKKGECPIAEDMAKKVLSLPLHPALTNEEIQRVMALFE